MNQEDFWFRFRRNFHELFYGPRTSVRILSRLVLLTFIAAFVASVAPTVADVLTPEEPGPVSTYVEPTPDPVASDVPTPEVSAEPSPDASASASPESTEPAPEYSVEPVASPKPTPTIEADKALSPQPKYLLKVPQSIAIDPRANSYFLPLIYLDGARFTLVCINGNGVNFDLSNKRMSNDSYDTRTVMVAGDGGPNVLIAGYTLDVMNVLNSGGGAFAYTNSGGLRDRSGTISAIATNKATIDPTFCSAAAPANRASFTFRPIGLQVDTKKGSGKLK